MEPGSKVRWVWIGGLIVLGILAYAWWSSPLIVTVTGVGEVKVPATEATVTFSLAESNASPVVAVTNLKAKAEGMRNVLAQYGVVESEIVESQARVVPAALVAQGGTGYTATMSMGGQTSRVSEAPQLTALLYERGATLVSQPVLTVADQAQFEKQAFQEALKNAKGQATSMALRNFKPFKKMAAISETTSTGGGTVTSRGEAGVQLEPGLQPSVAGDNLTITKVVEVTYRMW